MAPKKTLYSARVSGLSTFTKIACNALYDPMAPRFYLNRDQKSQYHMVAFFDTKIPCKPYVSSLTGLFSKKWFADVRSGKNAAHFFRTNTPGMSGNPGFLTIGSSVRQWSGKSRFAVNFGSFVR
jgi:hypothetical protein